MHDDLRRRLRKLGVVRGARELAAHPPHRRVAIEDLVPGRFHTTSHGQCFVAEETYPLDHPHGSLPLSAFLSLPPEVVAQVALDDTLAGIDLRQACFLDTETTGLSGGAGTMAFVVGLGFFTDAAREAAAGFCVHQYFLRDPGDEPAMVEALAEQLPEFEVLVSFNGRAFDVPILENRFILARVPPPTAGLPHLDLLHPARRLWHHALPSCALGALERDVLGVLREQDDVPGGEIPYLYRDYLRTGDARDMQRVLYHNVVDVLSLVTLAARLCLTFADPWGDHEHEKHEGHEEEHEGREEEREGREEEHEGHEEEHEGREEEHEGREEEREEHERLGGAEFYGLGRWYETDGRLAEAERAYSAALGDGGLAPELRAKALRDLGYLLKRAGRRPEAFACWQQLALEATDDVLAHVELAKHFEWHGKNLALAAGWTRAALAQVETWPGGLSRDDALAELQHRLARLERKMGK